jgi:hypothetical protein
VLGSIVTFRNLLLDSKVVVTIRIWILYRSMLRASALPGIPGSKHPGPAARTAVVTLAQIDGCFEHSRWQCPHLGAPVDQRGMRTGLEYYMKRGSDIKECGVGDEPGPCSIRLSNTHHSSTLSDSPRSVSRGASWQVWQSACVRGTAKLWLTVSSFWNFSAACVGANLGNCILQWQALTYFQDVQLSVISNALLAAPWIDQSLLCTYCFVVIIS